MEMNFDDRLNLSANVAHTVMPPCPTLTTTRPLKATKQGSRIPLIYRSLSNVLHASKLLAFVQ